MIPQIPVYVTLAFLFCTLFSLGMSYYVIAQSKHYSNIALKVTLGISLFLLLQGGLAYAGFYLEGNYTKPPRLMLSAFPTILVILVLFFTTKGRAFIDDLPLKPITYMQTIRILVEMCLYWLFLAKVVPEVMTFEGSNQDVWVGVTAPIVAYIAFQKGAIKKTLLLVWNIIGFLILMNIIIHGTLSAPTLMQQFGFEQPNIALLHFPFVWLQSFVAPLALLGHLISIRQLLRMKN